MQQHRAGNGHLRRHPEAFGESGSQRIVAGGRGADPLRALQATRADGPVCCLSPRGASAADPPLRSHGERTKGPGIPTGEEIVGGRDCPSPLLGLPLDSLSPRRDAPLPLQGLHAQAPEAPPCRCPDPRRLHSLLFVHGLTRSVIPFNLQKGLLNLGFGAPCDVEIEFERSDGQPLKTHAAKSKDGVTQSLPLYTGGDGVCGKVRQLQGLSSFEGEGGHSNSRDRLCPQIRPKGGSTGLGWQRGSDGMGGVCICMVEPWNLPSAWDNR